MTHQLLFNFLLRDQARFENYYTPPNQPIVHALQTAIKEKHSNVIYCWGTAGCGLTHLLQACCHAAAEIPLSAVYLPLRDLSWTPEILLGLESIDVICIDDLEALPRNQQAEEALFDCYNRLREQGRLLILASHIPLAHIGFQLPDLQSRLQWSLIFHIKSLNDEEKMQALLWQAQYRGFTLSVDVAHYLMNHTARNMTALCHNLDKLDMAAIREQRKITIPFVKKILFGGQD